MSTTVPVQFLPIGYYTNLLTSMYKSANKFIQWLSVPLSVADDISNLLASLPGAFDLDFAIGTQLDTIGVIENVSRVLPFQPSGGVSPVLDDDTYRLLIKATIANNEWDGNINSLYDTWNRLFPGGKIVIIDNQNMTAFVAISGTFSSIITDLITNNMIVPRPETVAYTYLFGNLPFFGFDFNNSFVAGFNVGNWVA